ncbi:MAG: hypothetical protein AAFZ15_13675 [Bacteroidota bacterium]
MMTSKNQYVKVLSNSENEVCLEYVPSGQVVTIARSYFDHLSMTGALKILGVS